MNTNKSKKAFEYLIYGTILISYFVLTFILFYRQCVSDNGLYNSDMLPYIEYINGTSDEYNFPYPLMFKMAEFFSIFIPLETALAFVTSLLNTFTLGMVIYYMHSVIGKYLSDIKSILLPIVVGISSVSLLFVSMLFIPGRLAIMGHAINKKCVGVFSANPYWNATSLCARPFTVINIFVAARLLEVYEKETEWKQYILFAITLFLATLTKPSYTLSLCVLFVIIFIVRLLASHFKNIKNTLIFGSMFLPAGFECIYQYSGVFQGVNSHGEESGIAFGIGKAWHLLTGNITASIVLAGAFALWILVTNINKLREHTFFRLSWELYFVSLGIFLFFYEKGFRMFHCNFAWGYVHSLFFVFISGFMILVENTFESKKTHQRFLVAMGWLLYLGHLLCGIHFFVYLFNGGDFFLY